MGRKLTALETNHCADTRELAIRFALWANGLTEVPSADRIRIHFGMTRATAYRWRAAYCAATGAQSNVRPPRRPTQADRRSARKKLVDLRKAVTPDERCRGCAFRQDHQRSDWWGWCAAHSFPVRASDLCNTFKTIQPAGSKRLSTAAQSHKETLPHE